VTWAGVDVSDRLANVLQRRLLDTKAHPSDGNSRGSNPTRGARPTTLEDIAAFLSTDLVDDRVIEELLFGFVWMKTPTWIPSRAPAHATPPLPRTYSLLKLLFLPNGLPLRTDRLHLVPDPSIVPLLRGGRVAAAVDVARRQLRARGLRPRRVIDDATLDSRCGRRLAAALLIPVFATRALVSNALIDIDDTTISPTTMRR